MTMVPGHCWELLEREESPAKRRAYHAKVRTGCITCKNRRVKCDEGKPLCSRCEKSGYQCAGYEDPSAKHDKVIIVPPPVKATSRPAALQPKPLRRSLAQVGGKFPIHIYRPSLAPHYFDQADIPYFERFRSQIVGDVGMWCGAHYWREAIRIIMHDECVRHAALAMSALLHVVEQPADLPSGPLTPIHRKAALNHYMKALAMLRKMLDSGMTTATTQSSIAASFFFAAIELMQGNISVADQTVASAILLLEDVTRVKGPDGRPTVHMDDDLLDVKLGFQKLGIAWGLCPFFQGQKDIYSTVTPNTYFRLPEQDSTSKTLHTYWNRFQQGLGLFMLSVRCGIVISPELMPAVEMQRLKYLSQLEQWMPVLNRWLDREDDSSRMSFLLTKMRAFALISKVFLVCFLDRSDVSYDLHNDTFQEILRCCEKFIPDRPPAHMKCSLDVDLFPIMSCLITKCRDQKMRQRALRLFSEMTYQQAFWNNRGLVKALRVLVELEHRGRDSTGFIPPSSRYYFVGSDWDFEHRQMMAAFVCVTSVPTESGDMPTVRVPIGF
ncbi:hypothetical protein F5B20DRAFT_369264 [Whalleya microplaca]|nr:hypothetical protein F5B20DRAFT_369264 [Whalleya microplaca]